MESLKINLHWLKKIYPVLIGAVAGFLYYSFIGCVTGTCAITSNPWTSTIVGALLGASFIGKRRNKKSTE
jgi:phage shock protein E